MAVTAALLVVPSSTASADRLARSAPRPEAAAAAAAHPLVRSTEFSVRASRCRTAGSARSMISRPAMVTCVGPATRTQTLITQELALVPAAGLCRLDHIVRNRHGSCAEIKFSFKIVEHPSGTVLGRGKVVATYMDMLSARSRKWVLPMTMDLVSASGDAVSGTSAEITIDCTGGCKNLTGQVELPLVLGEAAGTQFIIESTGSRTVTTRQAPDFFLTHPGASPTGKAKLPDLGPARCDSVAVARTQGCVFSDVAALYVLHVNGQGIKAVAQHIERAQRAKPHHFGWLGHGSPLTRLTVGSDIRKNRRRACRGVRVPPGMSCDEYPFAATYQGAAFFPGDSSAAAVPAKENSREGGLRVAMYKSERLLAKDAFWVIIKP